MSRFFLSTRSDVSAGVRRAVPDLPEDDAERGIPIRGNVALTPSAFSGLRQTHRETVRTAWRIAGICVRTLR